MEFVINGSILLVLFVIILLSKVINPETSYEYKVSLIVAGFGAIIFAFRFVSIISNDGFNLWPLFCLIGCGVYIASGGVKVSYKTVSGVFSTITKKPIGIIRAGTNWVDPWFEEIKANPDGPLNKSLDLQELLIEIPEIPWMQTQKRGVQAKIKNISFMLELNGDIRNLLNIEGGVKTVRKRINSYIEEFFLEHISMKDPLEIDQNKHKTIKDFTEKLEKEVNYWCLKKKYPYKIKEGIIISDVELEPEYYKVLAKAEYTRLEQEGKDVEAKALRIRVADFGKHILPNASEQQQIEAAMLALGIIKKDIQERKFAIDPVLAKLAMDIASYLKK